LISNNQIQSSDILTIINYRASRLGSGSCFTEPTCSAAVVLSTSLNSDVSHPIRKKHITNYEQNQQNISSHPGFEKPGIPALVPIYIIYQYYIILKSGHGLSRKL